MIRLTLPYPISANRYWRSFPHPHSGHTITTVSREAKDYKREVKRIAKEARVQPIAGPVEFRLELYPHLPQDWAKRARKDPLWWDLTVQCLDLDNARKVLVDALADIAFGNDSRIRKDPGEIMVPDGEARVVVTIVPYERAHPQLPLITAPAGPRGSLEPAF